MKRVLVFGNKLHDIVDVGHEFPVAPGMSWVDAPDDVAGSTHEFNGSEIVAKAPDVETPAQTEARLAAVVQSVLDSTAVARGYASILSMCTYATSTNPTFAADGQVGVAWRDAVWTYCYQVMADVLAGTRAVPTTEELLAGIPLISG
jgi:hypothetical protein